MLASAVLLVLVSTLVNIINPLPSEGQGRNRLHQSPSRSESVIQFKFTEESTTAAHLQTSHARMPRHTSPFQPLLDLLAEHSEYEHDPGKPQLAQVALFKTHKTGSTTLASVLFRYAARHQSRVFRCAQGSTVIPYDKHCWKLSWTRTPDAERRSFNFMYYHMSTHGHVTPMTFLRVLHLYDNLIDQPFVMTLMRDPMTHVLSWMCYYSGPDSVAKLEANILSGKMPDNIQTREFRISNEDEFNEFLDNQWHRVHMTCITEYFDECLVMMRRRFNWDMLDITYIRLLDSRDDMCVPRIQHI